MKTDGDRSDSIDEISIMKKEFRKVFLAFVNWETKDLTFTVVKKVMSEFSSFKSWHIDFYISETKYAKLCMRNSVREASHVLFKCL